MARPTRQQKSVRNEFVHCRTAPAHTVPRDTHTSSTHLPSRTPIQQPDIAPSSATCTSQLLQMRSDTTPDAPRDFAALQDPQSPDHGTITTTTSLQSTRTSNDNCLHTPRTSRETLAASAASTSRHRCSADCHSTTVTAKLVIHDATCGVSNNQWSYQGRSSRDLSTTRSTDPDVNN